MERKYYVCSVGEPGKDYVEDNFDRIIENDAFILHENTKQKGLYYKVTINDILLLKYNNLLVAYGEVKERMKVDDEEGEGWNLWAKVFRWYFKDENQKTSGISTYLIQENTLQGSGQMGTVKGIKQEFGLKKICEINQNTDLYIKIQTEMIYSKLMQTIQEKIELLKYKKQIILQGPPGTGKTRLAKQIAHSLCTPTTISETEIKEILIPNTIIRSAKDYVDYKIISIESSLVILQNEVGNPSNSNFVDIIKAYQDKTWENGTLENGSASFADAIAKHIYNYFQLNFSKAIQFHPAYSYEDFVRGITAKSNGTQVEYYTENKILGHIAEIAMDNFIESKKNLKIASKESWFKTKLLEYNQQVNEVLNTKEKYYLNKTSSFIQAIDEKSFYYYSDDYKAFIGGLKIQFKDFMGYFLNIPFDADYDKVFIPKLQQYRKLLIPLLKDFREFVGDIPEFKQVSEPIKERAYVLIIDEINRANLPAVLGELIYALEYRGKKVDSMYAIDDDNSLILPPNLYIIGTMNTADRSVGHLDYAIRRRFAFVDVLPTKEPIKEFALQRFKDVSSLFIKNYDSIDWSNPKPERSDFLAPDFRPEDVWLGHSYFITNDKDENNKPIPEEKQKEQLAIKLKYEVAPILKEYLKDGLLIDNNDVIKNLINELS